MEDDERARLVELAGQDVAAPTAAIAAATVVLLRDRDDAGNPEILMLRRDARLSFAADRWVFPGGKLDEEDFPRGVRSDDPEELAAAEARAAVREAAEEAGLDIDGAAMIRWSHWTPPPQETRRFSTAFFVAAAPDGDVVIDDGEIRDHRWVTAAEALALRDRGEIELLPPTFLTLLQLAEYRSVRELLEAAPEHPVEHYVTRIGRHGDDVVALFFGDIHYGLTREEIEATPLSDESPRHRMSIDSGPWSYQRTVGHHPFER